MTALDKAIDTVVVEDSMLAVTSEEAAFRDEVERRGGAEEAAWIVRRISGP